MNKKTNINPAPPVPAEDDGSDIRVTLELDNDTTVECEILTIFETDDMNYIALLPLNENGEENEDGEIFIYRYYEDMDGNPSLENIESDMEFELVSNFFDELLDAAEYEELE